MATWLKPPLAGYGARASGNADRPSMISDGKKRGKHMRSQSVKCYVLRMSLLLVLLLAGCVGRPSEQADLLFKQMTGPIVDRTLLLCTDRERYTHDDWVIILLENKTGGTVYFPDQSLGVQGFRFNESTQHWDSYNLGFGVGNPVRWKMEPDARPVEQGFYQFPTDHMVFDGAMAIRIRLLVIGYSLPLERGGGQKHGAYVDIEVTAR
jgi:hypothetical protein